MNPTKRLLYITNDSNWDTDVSILPDVARIFDLEVFCLSPKDPAVRKYRNKSLPGAKLHDCQFGRSKKDIRMALHSFVYGIRILIASAGKTAVWVLDNNLWYAYLFIALASPKNVIVSIHNYTDHTDAKSWSKRIKQSALSKFQFFHFHSSGQELVFKKDYPDKHSFSTQMPVKDFGCPTEVPSLENKQRRTFLFFGYIRDYKRPDLFIRASEILGDKAHFVIAGGGENLEHYKSMITPENKIESQLRFIENREIPDLFCNADFVVLPYDDSTQSGPLLIAYNYNVPVIASDIPVFCSMVEDRTTGYLFKKGDCSSLIEAIQNAIDMSGEKYVKMKSALSQRVEEYKKTSVFSQALRSFIETELCSRQ